MEHNDRSLLRLHVEATWGVQFSSQCLDEIDLTLEGTQPTWALCVADLAEGRIHIWRPNVTSSGRVDLRQRANGILATKEVAISSPEVHSGVALCVRDSRPDDAPAIRHVAQLLSEEDRPLIEEFEPGESGYYLQPAKRPLIGVIIEGRLVSVAHSSRHTHEACELGIHTLPASRRKGCALAATQLWMCEVAREGLVPIYSADAANIASLHLAKSAGYHAFARLLTLER